MCLIFSDNRIFAENVRKRNLLSEVSNCFAFPKIVGAHSSVPGIFDIFIPAIKRCIFYL